MKTNAIIRIVLYSLLALMLTGILVTGGQGVNLIFRINSSDGTVVNYEAHVEATSVKQLRIDWASGNMVIKKDNVDRIWIRETADGEIKHPMTYRCENGVLKLSHSNQVVYFGFQKPQEKNLVVIVPLDWNCDELRIDGAGLEITVTDLAVGELSVDGAGAVLNYSGSLGEADIDGADCVLTLSCRNNPRSISMDGAGCELNLTLPEGCGFQAEMDGLGCELETDLSFRKQDGVYISGDGYCKIDVDGLGCEVSIREGVAPSVAYPVRCGDDFTADLLLEMPEGEYAPGTIIRLRTDILTDVDLELYVNNKFVCKQTEAFSSDGTNYWEFYFTMPEDTAVIYFKTVDGILR